MVFAGVVGIGGFESLPLRHKREWVAKKVAAEKLKIEELSIAASQNPIAETVENMKAMNISEEMVQKVQTKLEDTARENTRAIQGQAYETFD
jgi:hypothetical protein